MFLIVEKSWIFSFSTFLIFFPFLSCLLSKVEISLKVKEAHANLQVLLDYYNIFVVSIRNFVISTRSFDPLSISFQVVPNQPQLAIFNKDKILLAFLFWRKKSKNSKSFFAPPLYIHVCDQQWKNGFRPANQLGSVSYLKGWILKIKTRKITGLNGLIRADLDPLQVRAGWTRVDPYLLRKN